MEDDNIESFSKEEYEELIEIIDAQYIALFKEMLDYRKVKYDTTDGYFILDANVRKNYPQLRDCLVSNLYNIKVF